jgi:cysteinyl-tRNA synthetase
MGYEVEYVRNFTDIDDKLINVQHTIAVLFNN